MSKKNKNIISVSLVALMVITILGVSYAYFTANLTGTETASTISVTAGKMEIAFSGGNNIVVKNISPSNDPIGTKTFTVKGTNTTDIDMNYRLNFVVQNNTFSNNAISYSLNGTNSGENGTTVPNITSRSLPSGESTNILGDGLFKNADNKIHTYELKLYFLETNENQNIDQGKEFAGYITIEGIE